MTRRPLIDEHARQDGLAAAVHRLEQQVRDLLLAPRVTTQATSATVPIDAVLETDPEWIDLTDGGASTLHSHGGGATDHGALTGLADDDHPQYRLESADHSHQTTGLQGGTLAVNVLTDVDTATVAPNLNEVLKWNGTNWVPAVYSASFTFSIASFTAASFNTGGTRLIGSGNYLAIGAVSLTAAYNNMPGGMTAAAALTGSASNWSGLALAGAVGPTVTTSVIQWPSTRTGTLTLTLTQSADGTTATASVSFTNTMRYGTNANGIGAQTEANLEALTEVGSASAPNESRDQTINNIPTGTAGHFLTFAHGASLSNIAQVQMDEGFGFTTASFASTATTLAPTVQTPVTNVANSLGFSESFDAITSRLADLPNGTRDFKLLTSAQASNYYYWGELNVASTADGAAVYTEANVEGNYATQPGKVLDANTRSKSATVNAAAGEYAYIAYPSRLGLLTSIVIGGFESIGDFWKDHTAGSELAITNAGGYTENYYVYVSKNPSFTNPTTMVIS